MQKTFNTKKFLSQNSIWLVLIVLVIIMSIAQPSFFSVDNLLTLLSGEAVKGIMAFGVMFAILSKGIDLTIGASAALVACITASLVQPEGYANAILPEGKDYTFWGKGVSQGHSTNRVVSGRSYRGQSCPYASKR